MKIVITRFVRVVYGLLLVLFGLNGFFSFLPIPEKEGFALEFMQALHHTGYILPVVATIMTGTGISLLLNRGVVLLLLLQLPVSFNIVAFHAFHDFSGLLPAYIIFAMNMFLIVRNIKHYKLLFNSHKEIQNESI